MTIDNGTTRAAFGLRLRGRVAPGPCSHVACLDHGHPATGAGQQQCRDQAGESGTGQDVVIHLAEGSAGQGRGGRAMSGPCATSAARGARG